MQVQTYREKSQDQIKGVDQEDESALRIREGFGHDVEQGARL